jgi:ATP-binding cassette subfamily B (MDR/TAP) protein 1
VYVLKAGQVVEQGYRYDLEVVDRKEGGVGEFRKMMEAQRETGGFLPEKDCESDRGMDDIQDALDEETEKEWVGRVPDHLKHQSMAVRPLTFGAWMFEAVAELVAPSVPSLPHSSSTQFPPNDNFTPILDRRRRPSSIDIPSPTSPQAAHTITSRRLSLQYSPTSPTSRTAFDEDAEEVFEKEKQTIEKSGVTARLGRGPSSRNGREVVRARWDADKFAPLTNVKVQKRDKEVIIDSDEQCPSIWGVMRSIYPSVPRKPLIFSGLVTCCLSGAMTPIFSFLLSRLLFEVSIGAQDVSTINKFGGILVGIAAIDGILLGTKYFVMEICGMSWVTRIRSTALYNVIVQDKKWFDRPENAASRMVQVLVKDGEDARDLVAVVWGQCCVVFSMLCVGLVWAFIRGWQVTLVGVGLAPVFAACMAVQSRLVAKCEVRNKRAREEVAKGYYEVGIDSFLFH